MKSIRRLLGLVALSAGASLLYFGISTGNLRFTLAGIISHCQACSASYARDE